MRYLLFLLFLFLGLQTAGAETLRLYAHQATLNGGMTLKDADTLATIHRWNDVQQKIVWKATLASGRYEVRLRCSEPYTGAAVAARCEGREVVSMIPTTPRWGDYRTVSLGILTIDQGGQHTITLQGTQLALKKPDEATRLSGKHGADEARHEEALPDVHWIEFEPTEAKPTDNATGINNNFCGREIFDGKTFDGWEGNNGQATMRWFRIQDGAIVAGSLSEGIPQNEFLRLKKKYSDFELRLKFRIVDPGNHGWNGGIQFRSRPNPELPYEMIGYQADIIGKRWGGLYDEQRRWCFLGSILSEQEKQPEQWNEYIIRCEGSRIRIWLNGKPVVDYIEPYAYYPHPKYGIIANKGYIALQIHERNTPYEIWYKDIRLEEIRSGMPAEVPHFAVGGKLAYGTPTADSLGWRVGIQAYDVKRVGTFFDAIHTTAALGLHYIEGVGMPLAPGSNVSFGPDMPEEWRQRMKQELIDNGITITSYYRRVNGRDDPEGTEKVFRFCHDLDITLVTDPIRVPSGNGSMDYYEALAVKYQVPMVLTNHPEADGSPYFDPDTVLYDLAGRSPLLGASVDFGHFMRDGRDPLPIVRKYVEAGRMHHFHFRDVSGLGANAYDVPIGFGVGHIREIFQLLFDAGIKPIVALEYERDMYNPLIDLIPSIGGIEGGLKELVRK